MPALNRTGKPAFTNSSLRGIDDDFGPEHADIFRPDLHPGLLLFKC